MFTAITNNIHNQEVMVTITLSVIGLAINSYNFLHFNTSEKLHRGSQQTIQKDCPLIVQTLLFS